MPFVGVVHTGVVASQFSVTLSCCIVVVVQLYTLISSWLVRHANIPVLLLVIVFLLHLEVAALHYIG